VNDAVRAARLRTDRELGDFRRAFAFAKRMKQAELARKLNLDARLNRTMKSRVNRPGES
jgi:hypothetical protein